jgi:hypothetical protein
MAELSLNQKWFAILRATRAAAARNPAPQQQPPPEHEPETEYKTYDEEEEAAANADKDEIPEAGPTDDAEPKIAPEDVGDSENAAPASSRNNDRLAQVTAGIKAASNYVANKLTDLATQARNATLNAVNKFGQLGFIGTAKALGAWIKLHPWETALIVVPLVALIFIVIALSATGFGSAGIVAGKSRQTVHRKGNILICCRQCGSSHSCGYRQRRCRFDIRDLYQRYDGRLWRFDRIRRSVAWINGLDGCSRGSLETLEESVTACTSTSAQRFAQARCRCREASCV